MSVKEYSLPYYEDVLEFLANSPSAQEIIEFRPPEIAQARFSELLQANRERMLTIQEEEEIDHYIQIERMISLLKAKAYSRLDKEEG
jgi:hypothetical protein